MVKKKLLHILFCNKLGQKPEDNFLMFLLYLNVKAKKLQNQN